MNAGYEILDVFSESKSGVEDKNEDGFVINGEYIAVIDGATSKSGMTFGGKTGGQLAKDAIIQTIRSLQGGEVCSEVFAKIQKALVEQLPVEKCEAISASAAIYSVSRKEIWSIGDCQILVDKKPVNTRKEVDGVLASARALAINALLQSGMTEEDLIEQDRAREMILPFLKLQRHLENKSCPYGYSALNNSFADYGKLASSALVMDVAGNREIVLASDGYLVLRETLAESEKVLIGILERDPLCYKEVISTKGILKPNKSFDDRTYIRFVVR